MTVSLGAGHDEFNTSDDIAVPVTVQGGDGDDRLLGASTQADDLDGGAGNDVVTLDAPGTAGDDLSGGDGRDSIDVSSDDPTTITLDDQPGDGPNGRADNIHSDFEVVYGGFGPDVIIGTADAEELNGRVGSDWIDGGGGNDRLDGGSGGSQPCEADVLIGGGGDDTLGPVNGGDSVAGQAGDDILIGADGNTFCTFGANGTDTGPGSTLSGRDGADTVSYAGGIKGAVEVSLDGVANDGLPGRNDLVGTDVEHIIGSVLDDVLTGDGRDNFIVAGAGDDIVDGGGGADVLLGGDGTDVLDYSARSAPVVVDLDGAPRDDGAAGEGDSVGPDVEAIWATPATTSSRVVPATTCSTAATGQTC